MAASLVQSGAGNVASGDATIVLTVTGGNTLILPIGTSGASTTVTVSDSKSNTWNQRVARHFVSGIYGIEVWVAEGIAAGSTTVTIHPNASATIRGVLEEWSGLASTPYDKHAEAGSTSTTTTPSSGSTAATSQNDELLLGYGVIGTGSVTITEPSGYTNIDTGAMGSGGDLFTTAYKVVATTGTYAYNPTLDIARSYHLGIATFKIAAAGGGSTVTKTPADSFTFAEGLTRDGTFSRKPTEVATFTTNLRRASVFSRKLSDTSTFATNLTYQRHLLRRLADTVTFVESLLRKGVFKRTPQDAFTTDEILLGSSTGQPAALPTHWRHKINVLLRRWRPFKPKSQGF